MRRRIAATLTLVVAVLVTLVAPASGASDRAPDRRGELSAAVDALDLPDVDAAVKLHCVGSVDDRGAGSVGCRSRVRPDLVRGDGAIASWQLWNIRIRANHSRIRTTGDGHKDRCSGRRNGRHDSGPLR